MQEFKVGQSVKVASLYQQFSGAIGAVTRVFSDSCEVAVVGLRPVISNEYLEAVDNESGADSGGAGGAGSGGGGDVGAGANDGSSDEAGACEVCGRPYTED